MPAALDVELGEGFLQCGSGGGDFLITEMFLFHRLLGAADSFLRGGFINVLFLDGHVREHGHAALGDFDKSFAHGEVSVHAIARDFQLAGFDRRHQRDVTRQNTKLSLDAGDDNHVHVFGVGFRVGSYDFKSECGHV